MNESFILLGSNIGKREQLIKDAISCIVDKYGTLIRKSSLYESEPWGFESEFNFLNQVILIETKLNPHELLEQLLKIEIDLGRDRTNKYETYVSRPIDIDILYYNNDVIDSIDLIVPHPRLHLRAFTLMPLCEIAPDYVHPFFLKTNKELLYECKDNLKVNVYKKSC